MNTIDEKNQSYWESYYEGKSINTVWVTFPSQFAVFVASNVNKHGAILEVGCGNGRDSVFFAEHFKEVISADYASHAVQIVQERFAGQNGCRSEVLDMYDEPQIRNFSSKYTTKMDVVYARFFLHAITEQGEINFWELASRVLKENGEIYVEYRNTHDDRKNLGDILTDSERSDGHYRRFLIDDEVIARAKKYGFELTYKISGKGFAKLHAEDPNVSRLVFKKAIN